MKKFKFLIFALTSSLFILNANSFADENSDKLLSVLEIANLFSRLDEANLFYENMQNYECVFYKTEDFKDKNAVAEQIFMRFEKPFKIFMGWENAPKKGLQVFYERGRFDNKLVIHSPGVLLGLVPILYLDQSSPWVHEGGSASFNIEDAGIGTFLTDFTKAVRQANSENKLRVKGEGQKVEVRFENTQKSDVYFAYKIEVEFDAETSLPVSQKLYNWEEKLIGLYEYKAIRINASEEAEIKKHMHGALYKIYRPKPEAAKKTYKASSNFNKRRV